MPIERLVKAREDQYKPDGCKEYRRLEKIYLGFDSYEYTKSEETIEALEEQGANTDEYLTDECKKKMDEHEETTRKARDDHIQECKESACTELREAQAEYDQEQKK